MRIEEYGVFFFVRIRKIRIFCPFEVEALEALEAPEVGGLAPTKDGFI